MTDENRSKVGKAGVAARIHEDRSKAAKKAAETRKEYDPDAFRKMSEKGGSARGSSDDDNL